MTTFSIHLQEYVSCFFSCCLFLCCVVFCFVLLINVSACMYRYKCKPA